jgi:hypothetical protein
MKRTPSCGSQMSLPVTYQAWVEAFARNHRLPIEWAEKGVRKEDHVLPWQRRMARKRAYGVYYVFKSPCAAACGSGRG